jgi:hypothetical protein
MPNTLTPADDDALRILFVHLYASLYIEDSVHNLLQDVQAPSCHNHVTVTPPLVKDVQPVDDVVRSSLGRLKAVE